MKYFFTILLGLIAHPVFSQINIWPEKLTDSTQSYLYIGVDNPVRIDGLRDDQLVSIGGGGGIISRIEANRFNIHVSFPTDDCKVSVTSKKSGKVLATKTFMVRVIYWPEATLNGFAFASLPKAHVLANPVLVAVIRKCFYKHETHIVSFDACFALAGDSVFVHITGNRFSQELIHKLKLTEPGTVITFKDIRALSPDAMTRKLEDFWIKLE